MGRRERPIRAEDGPVAVFAAQLRRLRVEAGSPTYRQLGERVHFAASGLSAATRGARLPTWPVTEAFVVACGGDVEEWRERWRAVSDEVHPLMVGAQVAKAEAAPRGLPADTRIFTGRAAELARLLSLADGAGAGGSPGAVVISAIDGMAGIGKTALALRAGHLLAGRFPGGQLFVDLRGFTPGQTARDPADTLAALLRALGVPAAGIPAQLEERAALYRDRLAGTRTLIVLDNAADEAQVLPLLPAADGCLVLVTSRRRLKALDDAMPLPLDVLAPDEAVALVRQAARVRDDSAAADDARWGQVAELCGRLPLALVIAGALLRTGGKAWTLARLIDRLTPRRAGDELAGYTDDTRSLGAVFDLSYRSLPENERLLFRRLGLLPGSEIDAYAAAALLDADLDSADLLVQRLSDHSLLIGVSPGRYRVHDLIRAHASTLAARLDPEPERTAARDRLLHYYAHTAQSASLPIARWPRPTPHGPAPNHAPDLVHPDTAQAWLRTELLNLDAAFTHTSTHGLDHHTIALAAGLAEILRIDGPWTRALHVHHTAAHTAEHLGRPDDHAIALTDLGRMRYLTADFPGAVDAFTRTLEIHRGLGDRRGEATALNDLGRVRFLTGDLPGTVDAYTRALEISRASGDRHGEAIALNGLGHLRELIDDYPGGEDAHIRALEIFHALGDRHGEANTLNDLGRVRQLAGDFPGAIDAHIRALEIFRALGDRRGEATTLNGQGRVRQLTGNHPGAIDAHARALEIFRALDDRRGEANALTNLGRARQLTGDYPGAIDAQTRALEIYGTLDDRLGEAQVLTDLGRARWLTGDYPGAVDALTRAMEMYRALGSRGDEAVALNYYAAALAAGGQRPRALTLYRQALAVHRELNKPDDEAISLEGIGEHHLASGDPAQGTTHLRQALEIYQRLGMRADADRVQARLDSLAAPGTQS
jgi:tetratricopeptide (TPR) repeat protein